MYPELTNLLPGSRARALRRAYFMRLAVVATLALAVVVFVHALLLVPGYLYARSQVGLQETRLSSLSDSSLTVAEKDIKARVALLRSSTTYVSTLETVPTASTAIRAVLAVARPGIALDGFAFTGPIGTSTPPRLAVSGMAASRDSLRQYAAALSQLSFVSNADLPIGAYAKENDIPFTITLSGTLRP